MASLTRFEALTLPHMKAAYNFAFWILRSREDAEDVVQEAYISAFRAFEDLRSDDIRPWLFAILRNAAYRSIAARRRSANIISFDAGPIRDDGTSRMTLDIADDAPGAEDEMISAAERSRVRAALAELPLAYREVVMLREIEELSYSEIAKITGTVIGTVMSRLARGRKELRALLTLQLEKDEIHG